MEMFRAIYSPLNYSDRVRLIELNFCEKFCFYTKLVVAGRGVDGTHKQHPVRP